MNAAAWPNSAGSQEIDVGDPVRRLAAEAGRRGISLSDLIAEYAEQGLRQAR
jgi:hypothetical protein